MADATVAGFGRGFVNIRWRGLVTRVVPLLGLLLLYLATGNEILRLFVGLWLALTTGLVASRWWKGSWERGDPRLRYTVVVVELGVILAVYIESYGLAFAGLCMVLALFTEFLDATVPRKR